MFGFICLVFPRCVSCLFGAASVGGLPRDAAWAGCVGSGLGGFAVTTPVSCSLHCKNCPTPITAPSSPLPLTFKHPISASTCSLHLLRCENSPVYLHPAITYIPPYLNLTLFTCTSTPTNAHTPLVPTPRPFQHPHLSLTYTHVQLTFLSVGG